MSNLPGLNFQLGEDIDALRNAVHDFAQTEIAPRAAEIDSSDQFPMDRWRKMGDLGVLGITTVSYTHLDVYKRQALAAANKRISNILKKAGDVDAHVSPVLLQDAAELALFDVMQSVLPLAQTQADDGDYTASLQTLAALRVPVDAFFEGVMVNAEAMDLRLNRLGLLKTLNLAMNRVADRARLAT